jgi:hypothetical protein
MSVRRSLPNLVLGTIGIGLSCRIVVDESSGKGFRWSRSFWFRNKEINVFITLFSPCSRRAVFKISCCCSCFLSQIFSFHFVLIFIYNVHQNVFHPPYNKVTSAAMVLSILTLGYGSMYYGMSHQQKKQGYWK